MLENKEKLLKTTQDYVKASVHYGHAPKEWNPKMAAYISHEKAGYHIIDLVKTCKLLKAASSFLERKAKKNAKFLFVGTTKISSPLVAKHAKSIDAFYINYRWLGGMLTNWPTIQKQIQRLKNLESFEGKQEKTRLSKKEYSKQKKELEKLRKLFGGIEKMEKLPDVVIFTNQLKDFLAIQECMKLGIPCISLVDTNCDPDLIPYPIPANDDSTSSVDFILKNIIESIKIGYNKD
jgi:small subunit ribosomal protein S2